jgi:hypothetical protein
VNDESKRETDVAREALSELQDSLDSAKRLVERTRFLLSGEAPSPDEALIAGAEAQAAAPSTSETVQKPSGE